MTAVWIGLGVFSFGIFCAFASVLAFKFQDPSTLGGVLGLIAVVALIAGIFTMLIASDNHRADLHDKFKQECIQKGGIPYSDFDNANDTCLGGSYVIR